MTTYNYEDKANAMFEIAMEDVKSDVDKAYGHAEELAYLIGKIEDYDLQEKLDEHLSYIMLYLEKI